MKKFKLKKTRIFGLLFLIMFICSLFTSISVLAQTDPFKISDVSVVNKSITVNGDVTDYDNDEVESDITFHSLSDFVTYKLVINNNLNKDITIIGISDDNDSDYIIYDYDSHENDVISANDSFDFLVTATYKNEVTDMTKRVENSRIKFTIKYLVDGEDGESNIIINPNTGDNSYIHFIILFISSVGLVVCVVLDKKHNKKLIKVVVLGLLLTPMVVTAATFSYDIELNTSCKLYDKQIVTYTDGNGDKQTIVVPYNELITGLEDPSKDGYNFEKWVLEDGSDFDATVPITEDIKLIPKFNAISYDIDYDLNGGSTSTDNPTTYTIEDNITLVNPTKNHYDFVGWEGTGLNEVTKNVVISGVTGDRSYTAVYSPKNYTVSFDSNGGNEIDSRTVTYGSTVGTLPEPTKDGYIFEGWYIDLDDENAVDETYAPESDVELHAKWRAYVCRKATTLHTERCLNPDSSQGCRGAKFDEGAVITYGSIIDSDVLQSGDAFDCDVNGEGYTKRFYYLRTVEDRAVLIADINYEGDKDGTSLNYHYDEAVTKLPTPEQWNNLPVTFNVDDGSVRAGRFVTFDDLYAATGKTNLTSTGSLDGHEYLFENTLYANADDGESIYRSTYWILPESPDGPYYRVHRKNRYVTTGESNTQNAVRPVIEVPLNLIQDTYIVKFDANGGSGTKYVNVKKGSSIGTLPTSEKESYVFGGWFTSRDYATKVTEDTIPNGYVTYYAKWISPVTDAILEKSSYSLEVGDTANIVITNADDIEAYEFSSNDTSIATVNSDGVITAKGVGTTTIKITGLSSNKTKTISVKVLTEITDFNVSFNSNGGSSVSDMTVPKNTAIGTLPTPTRTDYDFDGWYTDTSYSVKVTSSTVINDDMTLYAKWIPSDAVAMVGNKYYSSIQTAIDETDSTTVNVKLIKDVTITNYIDLSSKNVTKNVVIDLNNHSITNESTNVIKTNTNLEIKNGTLYCGSKNAGAVDVGVDGKFVMYSGRIEATGSRQAVYNNGGTVEIGGTAYLKAKADGSNSTKRATVQNVLGKTIITGGTIEGYGSSNSYAVTVNDGTLIIGSKDNVYDTGLITIKGNTNGIYSAVDYSLYDGMISGKSAAVNNEAKILNYEDNATKVKDEVDSYKRLYYTIS